MRRRLLALLMTTIPLASQPRWWMDEPVRLVQANLRETDGKLDPARLVRQVADFPANALLFGMGGIVAWYPTQVDFHYPSRYIPSGRDLFGEVLREAHAHGIHVIGRFDLSKTQKAVYDAHPEWFFRRQNGAPVVYNGLYATCINAGYYRGQAMKILAEALERYDVDGLFFNMFGNPSNDYSGNPVGLCHCESCKSRFRERYHRDLPDRPDADYREFLAASRDEVAREIAALIHRIRPHAAFLTYMQQYTDGITSESNTALGRPLPLWPYSASDNVNRARNSEPSKMAFNLSIGFVDIPYRMVSVAGPEIQARLYQNMAHGAGPAFVVLGTLDQEDETGIAAARLVFAWHQEHSDLYVGQENRARVLLLGGHGDAYRGFFRLLSEQHIPFAVIDGTESLDRRAGGFDLVIAPDSTPPELERYVRDGGRLLAAGIRPPGFLGIRSVHLWPDTRSAYLRIHDRELFPSLLGTRLLFLAGPYLETAPANKPLVTLIPPSMFGPPELVGADAQETDKPGLVLVPFGRGEAAYVPWDAGGLYYRFSSPGHAGLIADLIDHLLPHGRQLRTNAHPLVEMTIMAQPAHHRTLVHFVNLSGHSETAYFRPAQMRDIEVELAQDFHKARSVRLGQDLRAAGRKFVLPELGAYDVVIVE